MLEFNDFVHRNLQRQSEKKQDRKPQLPVSDRLLDCEATGVLTTPNGPVFILPDGRKSNWPN